MHNAEKSIQKQVYQCVFLESVSVIKLQRYYKQNCNMCVVRINKRIDE